MDSIYELNVQCNPLSPHYPAYKTDMIMMETLGKCNYEITQAYIHLDVLHSNNGFVSTMLRTSAQRLASELTTSAKLTLSTHLLTPHEDMHTLPHNTTYPFTHCNKVSHILNNKLGLLLSGV